MNNLETPERMTLTRQVVERIGSAIADGTYKSGDRIEEDTMTTLGVSRTVWREAMRILEGKGLILAKPQHGTRVTLPSAWNLFDHDVARWLTPGNVGTSFQHDATEFLAMLKFSALDPANVFYQQAVHALADITGTPVPAVPEADAA